MTKLLAFFKAEPVLVISGVCAALSCLLVPPSPAYMEYIDLRVLCLLFCLMAVVAGLQSCGVFVVLSQRLLSGRKNTRLLSLLLVLLPFFTSMVITNDVALITFVPFTLLILEMAELRERVIPVVVLQTVAANLGSMATPVGNPQNLFLCSRYTLSAGDFFAALLPYPLVSLAALIVGALLGPGRTIQVTFPQQARLERPGLLGALCVLLVLCLLSVFHVLHYGILTAVVVVCLLVLRRELLARVDYGLLLTFVFFFIFSGNLGELPPLREALAGLMEGSSLLTSALVSQVISNVPAAVLLANFTQDWRGLLLGVDLGGLGTPIASLASLISLKFYLRSRDAKPLSYFLWFTAANAAGLLVLLTVLSINFLGDGLAEVLDPKSRGKGEL